MKEEQNINLGVDMGFLDEEKHLKEKHDHFQEISNFIKSPAGKEIIKDKERKIINALNTLFNYTNKEDISYEKMLERVINLKYSLKDYAEFINSESEAEETKAILDVMSGRATK